MTPAPDLITAARAYLAAQEATAAYPEDEAERAEAEAKEAAARAVMLEALSRCEGQIIRTGDLTDAHYERAIGVIFRANRASTSHIQRELGLGYNAAAKLIERAETDGFVSRPDELGKRHISHHPPQPSVTVAEAAIVEAIDCLDGEPEYHHQGMGCGLEDRNITDRYEAMRYGWEKAMGRVYGEHIIPARDALRALTGEKA